MIKEERTTDPKRPFVVFTWSKMAKWHVFILTCFRGRSFGKGERKPETTRHLQDLPGWRSQCAVRALWAPSDMRNMCAYHAVLSCVQTNHLWTGSGAENRLMRGQLCKSNVKGTMQHFFNMELKRTENLFMLLVFSINQCRAWGNKALDIRKPAMAKTLASSQSRLSQTLVQSCVLFSSDVCCRGCQHPAGRVFQFITGVWSNRGENGGKVGSCPSPVYTSWVVCSCLWSFMDLGISSTAREDSHSVCC